MTKQHIDRLVILDSILGGTKKYYSRKELLNAVNRRLYKPISISSLDKDIRGLRELLECQSQRVRLHSGQKEGYCYDTKGGYSLFEDFVDERDVRNLILLVEFLISKYPDLCPEMIETAVRLTARCPSLDVKELFAAAVRRHQRLRRDRKEIGIIKNLRESCYESKAIKASVIHLSGKMIEMVVSPLELVSMSGELWLACTLHSKEGEYSFKMLPIANIDDFHHTDERFKTTDNYANLIEQDFDAHILTDLIRMELHEKVSH